MATERDRHYGTPITANAKLGVNVVSLQGRHAVKLIDHGLALPQLGDKGNIPGADGHATSLELGYPITASEL